MNSNYDNFNVWVSNLKLQASTFSYTALFLMTTKLPKKEKKGMLLIL